MREKCKSIKSIRNDTMINRQLLHPESIVVVGGSNNVHKPGGALVRNLISGGYKGTLRIAGRQGVP